MSRDLADRFDRDLEAPPDVTARARAVRQRGAKQPTPMNLDARITAARNGGFAPAAVASWSDLWAHWQAD